MAGLLDRPNQVTRRADTWRPPQIHRAETPTARVVAGLRRFLALQEGSVRRDLTALLPTLRGVVLDVGCGGQPYRSLISPEASYRAIDSADAESQFGYSMPDTTYYRGDRWPVGDDSVDAILCTETLEHVPEPSRFLAEAARCLKRGGRIILTVPFAARWHYIPHDYWRFTPSGLQRLLAEAGFDDVDVFARGNELTVACYKAMALLLPLLIPQGGGLAKRATRIALGLLTSPILLILAIVGNLSLRGGGGDDCLGYTAIATKRG